MFATKATVDVGFAAYAVLGGPIGLAIGGTYGLLDLYVQSLPEHIPQYGPRAGRSVDGYTAVFDKADDIRIRNIIDSSSSFAAGFIGPKP